MLGGLRAPHRNADADENANENSDANADRDTDASSWPTLHAARIRPRQGIPCRHLGARVAG